MADPVRRAARLLAEIMSRDDGLTPADIDDLSEDLTTLVRQRYGVTVVGGPADTVAVTMERRKTAALLFDRVWTPPLLADGTPNDIACYTASDTELHLQVLLLVLANANVVPTNRSDHAQRWAHDATMKLIAESMFTAAGVCATPVYVSRVARERDFIIGDRDTLVSVIEDLGVVDEAKLTWEQVTEFRCDARVRQDYRRMMHWLDREMVGKPSSFIQNEMAVRLERYEAGLRKHGIETVLGAVESLTDPAFISATAAVVASVAFAVDLPSAAVSTVIIAGTRVSCSLVRKRLDAAESKGGSFGDISYVHELKQGLSK